MSGSGLSVLFKIRPAYCSNFHGYSGISVVFRHFGKSCDPFFKSKLTLYENRMDFCFAKMFVKMVPKLIFDGAVMLGIFTGSQVFIKSMIN